QVLAAAPVKFKAPAEVTARVPEVVVFTVRGPAVTLIVRPPVPGPVIFRAVVPENVRSPAPIVKAPPAVNRPVPGAMAPLLVVCSDNVLPEPMSQVEAAAPVKFRAPALLTARVRVPDAPVVDSVSGPVSSVMVRPPVVGPVMVRAAVPVKVSLAPGLM